MLEDNIKMRSFMFLPAHNKRYIDKALDSEADAIILDLEDAVPPSEREEARNNIIGYDKNGMLAERKNVFVRINSIGTEDFVKDICELTLNGIDGFMPSKIRTVEDILFIDRLLDFFEIRNHLELKKYKLTPLIETTEAIENIAGIAGASSRLLALCLGGEDYLNDLGSTYTYQQSALAYARARLVNASRAHKILPIDTPYLNINDTNGFEENESLAYKNGFAGCLLLNPKQIESANRVFSPSQKEVEFSEQVIKAIDEVKESGKSGVAMLNGMMVGPPMRNRAETVLKRLS